eukprot:2591448-Amphidinium_carterae.2
MTSNQQVHELSLKRLLLFAVVRSLWAMAQKSAGYATRISRHVWGSTIGALTDIASQAGARINTALCFIGRDIASFVEMGISSAVFSMLYWSLGPVQ